MATGFVPGVCVCVSVRVCVCVCACVCAHERACVRGTCQHHNSHHVCALVRACMCVYIHTCMYIICTYTCIQHDICTHTCMQIHIRAYKYTYFYALHHYRSTRSRDIRNALPEIKSRPPSSEKYGGLSQFDKPSRARKALSQVQV